jgi:hypothetical protein
VCVCTGCPGPCGRAFHLECLSLPSMPADAEWMCPDCDSHTHTCLYCGKASDDLEPGARIDDVAVRKCSMKRCGRFYHTRSDPARLPHAPIPVCPFLPHTCNILMMCKRSRPLLCCVFCCVLAGHRCGSCLEAMALVTWSSDKKTFRCPQHYCSSCDNASGTGNNVIVLCNRCPVAFHLTCLPDSITRLNRKVMVCPAHEPGGPSVKVGVRLHSRAPLLPPPRVFPAHARQPVAFL